MGYNILLNDSFQDLWHQKADFTIMQCVLIGLFLFLCGIVLCAVNWYLQVGIILEFGYPKRTKREKRKGNLRWIRQYSFSNRVLLWRPCKEAFRKGFMLWLAWFLNLLNVIACVICCAALFLVILTRGAGWSLILLLFPYGVLMFCIAVEFIPSLLFLPSERRRYGIKK